MAKNVNKHNEKDFEIDNMQVGLFITKLRKEAGLCQQELAQELLVSNQAVSKWEKGKCLPDITIQKRICNVCNITLEELHKGKRDIAGRRKKKLLKLENKIFLIAIIIFIPLLIFFGRFYVKNHDSIEIFYSKDNITSSSNNLKVNMIIFKTYTRFVMFINNIEPVDDNITDTDLLDLKIYSDDKTIYKTNRISNEAIEFDLKKNINMNNIKVKLTVNTIDNATKIFESNISLYKFVSVENNNDNYSERNYELLSKDEIIKKLLDNGFTKTGLNQYEKVINGDNKTMNIQYDIDCNTINISYVHNEYTEKIKVNYEYNYFQTIVFNKNDINNVVEKYKYDLKNKKISCEIGECATAKKTRKIVEEYAFLPQVG